MAVPSFTAESSLRAAVGTYAVRGLRGSARGAAVVPALDTLCTGCAAVGGFGGIRGVGRRSCCTETWSWNPVTRRHERRLACWFESCALGSGGVLAF